MRALPREGMTTDRLQLRREYFALKRERIIAELNDRITADDRVESVMIFVADGVTLVRRDDSSSTP